MARPLVPATLALLLAACHCLAGGYTAVGTITSTVPVIEPTVRLCTSAQASSCVDGQVRLPVDPTDPSAQFEFEVKQEGSLGGDQVGECNDKSVLVLEAANCDRYVKDFAPDLYVNLRVDLVCR